MRSQGELSDGSCWASGWYGMPSALGGMRIENFDDVTCRVPGG